MMICCSLYLGHRSLTRDVEAQIALLTRNTELKTRLHEVLQTIFVQ